MAMTQFTVDVANHQKQANQPNDEGGLTATQFKLLCDQASIDIKNFLNSTLLSEIDSLIATKAELAGIVLGTVSDGSITDVKLSNTAGQTKDTVATHISNTTTAHGLNLYAKTALPPWIPLTLLNGWNNGANLGYWKDALGYVNVYFTGSGATTGGTIMVNALPAGCRPSIPITTPCDTNDNPANHTTVPVVVENTGIIHIGEQACKTSLVVNLRFRADQ